METERIARIYESALWRGNPLLVLLLGITEKGEYRRISRALQLKGNETMLDLACGPGIYTRRFAREVSRGEVLGLDLSWPMLKQGKYLVQKNGLTNIRLLQGSALALPFSNGRFDAINCAAALHLFDDLVGTFMEVFRVLKPGGQFTFSTFRYPPNKLIAFYLRLRQSFAGIRAFRHKDLEDGLREAGFTETRYLHIKGIWVVMSASKPR